MGLSRGTRMSGVWIRWRRRDHLWQQHPGHPILVRPQSHLERLGHRSPRLGLAERLPKIRRANLLTRSRSPVRQRA